MLLDKIVALRAIYALGESLQKRVGVDHVATANARRSGLIRVRWCRGHFLSWDLVCAEAATQS